MKAFSILLLVIFSSLFSQSENITVSLLYFSNIEDSSVNSSGKNYIGKALTELSYAELFRIKGIILTERNSLEKLLNETELSMTGLVDETTAPKIGKMLGAKTIIDGTYLVSGKNCIVTYKIIDTEKGIILKAGTVSGTTDNIGDLVKNFTLSAGASLKEIYPSIDITQLKTSSSAKISINSAEIFGTALDMKDRGKHAEAAELLKKLLGSNPDYQVFKNALKDLEKRVTDYDKAREEAIRKEANQPMTWNNFMKLTTAYVSSMKFTMLYEISMKYRNNPPEIPEGYIMESSELINYYIIAALNGLNKYSEVIHEGEAFLQKYPASVYYTVVKTYIRLSSENLKEHEKNKITIANSLKAIEEKFSSQGESAQNYYKGLELYTKKFYKEAYETFKKVNLKESMSIGTTGDNILFYIFQCHALIPDKKGAEKALKTMEILYPDSEYISGMKTQIDFIGE